MGIRIPGLRCAPTWALESRPFGAEGGKKAAWTRGYRPHDAAGARMPARRGLRGTRRWGTRTTIGLCSDLRRRFGWIDWRWPGWACGRFTGACARAVVENQNAEAGHDRHVGHVEDARS
jgi:hypothetical protein